MVAVDDLRLFLTADDLDLDAGLLLDALDDIRSVEGVAHGRGSASAEALYVVDLHQLAIGLHQPSEVLLLLGGELADREHVETEPQRDTEQQAFIEHVRLVVPFLDQ